MINLSFLIRQISLITLLTVGVSLEMIGGVIDLAFAAQLSASALVGIFLIAGGCPVWVGCIGILFFNFFLGFLKAVFLVKLRVPSIIFTLAMQVILSNFLLATVDYTGIVIPELRESYRGNIYIGMELTITVLCVAGAFFFLEKSYYGKYCRMLGETLPLAREMFWHFRSGPSICFVIFFHICRISYVSHREQQQRIGRDLSLSNPHGGVFGRRSSKYRKRTYIRNAVRRFGGDVGGYVPNRERLPVPF